MRLPESAGMWLALSFTVGCTTIPAPALQAPYFRDAGDSKLLQGVVRKQSQLAVKCAGKPQCDHVFFTRALAALYESRESAIHHFERVIALAPKSQLAESSRLWLQLLQTGEFPADQSWLVSIFTGPATARTQTLLSQAIERTVHDLLDREITIQQLRAIQDSEAQSLEALQRELQDQEMRSLLYGCHGRAKFMRDMRQKLTFDVIELLKFRAHPLHRIAQFAQFTGRMAIQRRLKITLLHFLNDGLETTQWAKNIVACRRRQTQTEQESHQHPLSRDTLGLNRTGP